MAAPAYSKEEISALRGIFALYDPDGTGEISSGARRPRVDTRT